MDASLKKGLLRVKSSGIRSCGSSLFFLRDSSFENGEPFWPCLGTFWQWPCSYTLVFPNTAVLRLPQWRRCCGMFAPLGRLQASSCQVPFHMSALQGNAFVCCWHFQEEAHVPCLSYTPRCMCAARPWCYDSMAEQCSFLRKILLDMQGLLVVGSKLSMCHRCIPGGLI